MNREIAIRYCDEYLARHIADIDKEFLIVAKEALQLEPCEDVISRNATIKYLCTNMNWHDEDGEIADDEEKLNAITDLVNGVPPVAPQQKIGRWIDTAEEYYKAINEKGGGVNENTPYFTDDIACSECLAKFSVIDNETQRFKCCPNCGVKMVEPQEGSDKK